MARIKETFDSRAWFMLECDDHNCRQRFDDSQWYAYEDDLLADAKDDGWQIAEQAWENGYIQALKNMNPMPGEEPPEYTPNPYRKENA